MPTATYTDTGFMLLEQGLNCIGLDLSTGENRLDLTRLNNPNTDNPDNASEWCPGEAANPNLADYCVNLPKSIRDQVKQRLCGVIIGVPEFGVPSGKVRLNHLGMNNVSLSWSAAHGGSILLSLRFESTGKELLGTYHGQVNNAELRIYLALRVNRCTGQFGTTVFTRFRADVNIIGLADELERTLGIRDRIRRSIAAGIRAALAPSAADLARWLLSSVTESNQPAPPAGAFYHRMDITDGQAVIAWTPSSQSARIARIVVESVQPDTGGDSERLSLQLRSIVGDQGLSVACSASPYHQLPLPLRLNCVPVFDGNPLGIRISMKAIDLSGPHPVPQTLGEIVRSFSGPGYGVGVHTDSNGELVATYRITT